MIRIITALVLAYVIVAPMPGQNLAVTITPNPSVIGQGAAVLIRNQSPYIIAFTDSCFIRQISRARPDGETVWQASACADVVTYVPPGGFVEDAWNGLDSQGGMAPPDTYWMVISYLRADAWEPMTERFALTVHGDLPGPFLTAIVPPQIGDNLHLAIDAPAFPGGSYLAAAAFTTNRGFDLGGGLYVALDLDDLFALSLASETDGIFQNFQGSLDSNGHTEKPYVSIPGLPELVGRGFHVQALVAPVANPIEGVALTNPLSLVIGL